MGATVFVVRDSTEPVTPYRPRRHDRRKRANCSSLIPRTRRDLRALPPDKLNLLFGQRLTELAEFLFYRCSEIVERGNRIRNNFVPDITDDALHRRHAGQRPRPADLAPTRTSFLSAAATREPKWPIPKCSGAAFTKWSRAAPTSRRKSPPTSPPSSPKRPAWDRSSMAIRARPAQVIPGNPYVVARNLAANREYDGPVVCTEPYFMNNHTVYQRLLAGDYDGQKTFDGKSYEQHFPRVCRLRRPGIGQGLRRFHRHRGRQSPASDRRHSEVSPHAKSARPHIGELSGTATLTQIYLLSR